MTHLLIDESSLYLNVRTKTVVAVLNQDTEKATIVTYVNGGATGKPRTVPLSSMHQSTLRSNGEAYASGYVPVTQAAPANDKPSIRSAMDFIDLDMLDAMSSDELTALAAEQAKIMDSAKSIVERAKVILKSRRPAGTDLLIQGDYALVYKPGKKFDAKTALRNLSKEDFARILLPKPDAIHARKVFEFEPDKLELCLKDDGPSLTIRKATDEDQAKLAASAVPLDGDEEYSFVI